MGFTAMSLVPTVGKDGHGDGMRRPFYREGLEGFGEAMSFEVSLAVASTSQFLGVSLRALPPSYQFCCSQTPPPFFLGDQVIKPQSRLRDEAAWGTGHLCLFP